MAEAVMASAFYIKECDFYRKCSNKEWQNFIKHSRSM